MSPAQITTSAVLFYRCESDEPIAFAWYQRAVELFNSYKLSPIFFTASGGDFELDDCYVLADGNGELFRWGDPTPIRFRRGDLIQALQDRVIDSLSLDTPRPNGHDRSDWSLKATVSSFEGEFFLGIDQELVPEPADLIRQAHKIASGLLEVGYGFAFQMPLENDPECFAAGIRPSKYADFKKLLRHRREGTKPQKAADDLWHDELTGERRHLTGLFRDAYLVNLLSAAHVQAAELTNRRIGTLTETKRYALALGVDRARDSRCPGVAGEAQITRQPGRALSASTR